MEVSMFTHTWVLQEPCEVGRQGLLSPTFERWVMGETGSSQGPPPVKDGGVRTCKGRTKNLRGISWSAPRETDGLQSCSGFCASCIFSKWG